MSGVRIPHFPRKLHRNVELFWFYTMYTIYALSSTTRNYIYVGLTGDLEKRMAYHNGGFEKTTKPYRPFTLLYTEQAATRQEARAREKYWKSGTGKEQLKK